MEKPNLALRLYENAKYGHTRGKGLRHQALYNGTIDLQCPRVKYLVDVVTYDHWEASAQSEDSMQIIRLAQDLLIIKERDPFDSIGRKTLLASWIKRLDTPLIKPRIEGFFVMDAKTGEAWLTLTDPTHALTFIEELRIRGCDKVRNGPDLFASNYELALVA
ncbi:MAG: hypothetical protein ACO3PI_07895 [Burkholderiaceae bacterium]